MRPIYSLERTVLPNGKIVNRAATMTCAVPRTLEHRDELIRLHAKEGRPLKSIAADFGMSVPQAWRIVNGGRSGRNQPRRKRGG